MRRLVPCTVLLAALTLTFSACREASQEDLENSCGSGAIAVNNECFPAVVCGAGTIQVGNDCVNAEGASCGEGTTANDAGECVPNTADFCAQGTRESDGRCVPEQVLACGTGTAEDGGVCVPTIAFDCGPGTTSVPSDTVEFQCELTCVPPEVWDSVAGACVDECGPGTTFGDNGFCEASCTNEEYYDAELDTCLSVPTCVAGAIFNEDLNACEGWPWTELTLDTVCARRAFALCQNFIDCCDNAGVQSIFDVDLDIDLTHCVANELSYCEQTALARDRYLANQDPPQVEAVPEGLTAFDEHFADLGCVRDVNWLSWDPDLVAGLVRGVVTEGNICFEHRACAEADDYCWWGRQAVTHAWQLDSSSSGYNNETEDANDADSSNDLNFFPAGAGEDDAFYVGAEFLFQGVLLEIGTAGEGDYEVVWEYWDGDSFVEFGSYDDESESLKLDGFHTVSFDVPEDWETDTISSEGPYYWARARRDGETVDTDPLGNRVWLIETVKRCTQRGAQDEPCLLGTGLEVPQRTCLDGLECTDTDEGETGFTCENIDRVLGSSCPAEGGYAPRIDAGVDITWCGGGELVCRPSDDTADFDKAWVINDPEGAVNHEDVTDDFADTDTPGDVTPFPDTDTPVGDQFAIGFEQPFNHFVIAYDTVPVGGGLHYLYWNGSELVRFPVVRSSLVDGVLEVSLPDEIPADWQAQDINGTELYYVVLEVTSAFTTIPTVSQGQVRVTFCRNHLAEDAECPRRPGTLGVDWCEAGTYCEDGGDDPDTCQPKLARGDACDIEFERNLRLGWFGSRSEHTACEDDLRCTIVEVDTDTYETQCQPAEDVCLFLLPNCELEELAGVGSCDEI